MKKLFLILIFITSVYATTYVPVDSGWLFNPRDIYGWHVFEGYTAANNNYYKNATYNNSGGIEYLRSYIHVFASASSSNNRLFQYLFIGDNVTGIKGEQEVLVINYTSACTSVAYACDIGLALVQLWNTETWDVASGGPFLEWINVTKLEANTASNYTFTIYIWPNETIYVYDKLDQFQSEHDLSGYDNVSIATFISNPWNQFTIGQEENTAYIETWGVFRKASEPSDTWVVNNSVNFTSDVISQNCGFLNDNYTNCGPTADLTPSFSFLTLGDASCKIWNESKKYSELSSISDCSTTGTDYHICSFPENLVDKNTHIIYVACKASVHENDVFLDANVWNVTIDSYYNRPLQVWQDITDLSNGTTVTARGDLLLDRNLYVGYTVTAERYCQTSTGSCFDLDDLTVSGSAVQKSGDTMEGILSMGGYDLIGLDLMTWNSDLISMDGTNGYINTSYLTSNQLRSNTYLSTTIPFNFYDDGSELYWNASAVPDSVGIETENSKLLVYNEPSVGNDWKVFQIFSKEGSDVTEFIIHKAGTQRSAFNARSFRIGGPANSSCNGLTEEVDCQTDTTGADLVLQDDFWNNGTIINKGGINTTGNITTGQGMTEWNGTCLNTYINDVVVMAQCV